jgi:hypothetical protein
MKSVRLRVGFPTDDKLFIWTFPRRCLSQLQFEITTGEWKFIYGLKALGAEMTGDLELKGINDRRMAKVSLRKTK